MTANSTFLKDDHVPDGLGEGGKRKEACFGVLHRRILSSLIDVKKGEVDEGG
jgi:hypothetical protein